MLYLIKAGWDNPLEDLLPLDPQPSTPGMLFGRRSYAISGGVIDENPYVPFEYNALEDGEMLQSILSQFGLLTLDADTTAPVSVYVQDRKYNWVLRNGIAVAPEPGQDGARKDFFLRDFVILVNSLRPQA